MNEYTQDWGILPHLNNGEMFAITLLALAALWLTIGVLEKRENDENDIQEVTND